MREGGHSSLHGIHIGNHSNNTNQNNTSYNNTNCSQIKEKENIWVRNLSSTPLTEAQTQLLAHGPNFAVVPSVHQLGNIK